MKDKKGRKCQGWDKLKRQEWVSLVAGYKCNKRVEEGEEFEGGWRWVGEGKERGWKRIGE